MTRAEKVAMAAELRGQGLLLRQIAERMGAPIGTVSDWLNDPDGSRLRTRKDSYRGECVDCGAPTSGSNGAAQAPQRCHACNVSAYQAGRYARAEQRAHRIVELWASGRTDVQIAAVLGKTVGSVRADIPRLRKAGYDLPYRRPDVVEHARALGLRARGPQGWLAGDRA